MSLFHTITISEIVFVCLFGLLYALYLVRVVRIGMALGSPMYMAFVKVLPRGLWFLLIIIALLGPTFGEKTREIEVVGKDIYIALDLSTSMNAHDVQPTRLEKLKFELKKIVSAFSNDRLGLIIFSSEAFVQCPLTYDQSALNLFIDALSTNLVPNAGTNFGPPLNMALNKINSEESLVTQQTSKVIILISDGEDFGEETEAIVEEVESSGIKLFTLGIGTQTGSSIITKKGVKRDRQGNEVITKLQPESLIAIAMQTGGKYYEISERTNDVSRLINEISLIEGEVRDTRQADVADNKYMYPLFLALVLLALDVLISINTLKL